MIIIIINDVFHEELFHSFLWLGQNKGAVNLQKTENCWSLSVIYSHYLPTIIHWYKSKMLKIVYK